MKKSILLFLIGFAFSFAGDCQIAKGNWIMGGGASFVSSTYGGAFSPSEKQISIQLSGNVGHFFIDKFAVGLKPGYERMEVYGPVAHTIANVYSLGPFVRYYLLPMDKFVNVFSEISYQFGIATTNDPKSNTSNNKWSGSLGCSAFFNTSVGIEFTLGYSYYTYNNNSNHEKSIIAGIGFQFYLERNSQ